MVLRRGRLHVFVTFPAVWGQTKTHRGAVGTGTSRRAISPRSDPQTPAPPARLANNSRQPIDQQQPRTNQLTAASLASTLLQSLQAHPLQKMPAAKQSQYILRHLVFLQEQGRGPDLSHVLV